MFMQKLPWINNPLKCLSQIMLQENAATGFLFLTGIFIGSMTMGIAALLSICCGILTAQILKYNKSEIEKGLYGFSAALTGIALIFYFKPVLIVWISIIIASIFATILQHECMKRNIPAFTLPFILVTWITLFIFDALYPVGSSEFLNAPALPVHDFTFAIKGFGQIIFQQTVFSGCVFFAGVFISSPVAALYGLAGSVLAAIISSQLGMPADAVEMGLFSYNAILCALVFAGNKTHDGIWVFSAVILSVIISILMSGYDLPQLTFPFVAASWFTLLLRKYSIRFIKIQS